MDAAQRSTSDQFWLAKGYKQLRKLLLSRDPLAVQGTDRAHDAYEPYLEPLRDALERGEVTGLGPLLTELHDQLGVARDEMRDHELGVSIAIWFDTARRGPLSP